MSWTIIGVMAAGAYAFKALGLFALSRVEMPTPIAQLVQFIPAALFCGIVVTQTLGDGSADVVATRVLGVAAGGIAVWRRAPLPVVIVISAAVAALARAVT